MISISSCNNEPSTLSEYKQWFAKDENGFIKTKTIGEFKYSVQYRPSALMATSELRNNKKYTKEFLDSITNSYGDSYYFLLEISEAKDSTGNPLYSSSESYQKFMKQLEIMAFRLKENASLKIGVNEISASIYHFERGYELGNSNRVLFGFTVPDNVPQTSPIIFTYYDNIYSMSKLKFKFNIDKSDIPDVPLAINN